MQTWIRFAMAPKKERRRRAWELFCEGLPLNRMKMKELTEILREGGRVSRRKFPLLFILYLLFWFISLVYTNEFKQHHNNTGASCDHLWSPISLSYFFMLCLLFYKSNKNIRKKFDWRFSLQLLLQKIGIFFFFFFFLNYDEYILTSDYANRRFLLLLLICLIHFKTKTSSLFFFLFFLSSI